MQINFNGQKTINQVIVYTLQDNYANPVDPPDNMTFTLYGVTGFQVQGWNGSALGQPRRGGVRQQPGQARGQLPRLHHQHDPGQRHRGARLFRPHRRDRGMDFERGGGGGGGAATTTALSSSRNPSIRHKTVTFTASVTGNNPTGTVNFTDGGTSIPGCAAAALAGGAASCVAGLNLGTHSIVATYSGNASNQGSTSAPLSQVVTQ